MKIATYNVNGINARLPVLLRWLTETAPDVVCLQELKAPQEKFPQQAIRDAGYSAIWKGQKSWNGVAILGRGIELAETRSMLPGDDQDEQSRYIETIVNGISVGCLYLPNGNPVPGPKFDYKLRWFDRLITYAASLLETHTPTILAGDFNVIPTNLDASQPERWVQDALARPESRAAYDKLLELGWIDSLRKLSPTQSIYTYWDYYGYAYQRNTGLRIDHMLVNSELSEQVLEAGVDRHVRGWEKTSDHAPTWIKLSRQFTNPVG
ncbi:exodeoxyribonuclease III [Spirosoma radiotolerans]|uniref:Exodeoxyribonuclease III n=1 Tax=Spirosoma radiotolerans TaxID=1379870 RepID=A0A0E3ZR39_9BACT|nr:exodeoxyribonuclease III [Spirosoma radiotolerans]AKD53564.1 exodeoxyribonuclease III [Spirosoma radiotolerans]